MHRKGFFLARLIPQGINRGINRAKALSDDTAIGLYARYFVPVSLQPVVGSRFLVLSLLGERRDAARFATARIGYLLSRLFEWMRKNPVDHPRDSLAKALDAARNGREPIIDLPDGTRITTYGTPADYEAAKTIIAERERVRIETGLETGGASPASASVSLQNPKGFPRTRR